MKIKNQELLEALEKVRPGLSNKAIVEQTDHFIFDKDYVRTYNDRISISYPFKTGFCVAVKADEFFKFVSKIQQDDEVDFDLDGSFLVMSGKNMGRAKVAVSSEVVCPIVDLKSRKWPKLPKNFSEAIRFASFSAGSNMLARELTCLWIKDKYILSSDGFRATKFEMDEPMPEFLMPATIAQELSKFSPDSYQIESQGVWHHFRQGTKLFFHCRVFEGTWLNGFNAEVSEDDVFGLFDNKGDVVKIPEGLVETVERAKVFAENIEQGQDMIFLSVDSGKLRCRGEGILGDIEKEFEIDYKEKSFDVYVSANALIEILGHVKEMKVSESRLSFEGPNFQHVITLMQKK